MTVLNSTLTESGSFSFKGNVVIYDGPMPCQDRWLNLCCEVVTLGLKEKRPCDIEVVRKRFLPLRSSLPWIRQLGLMEELLLIHEQKANKVVISCHPTNADPKIGSVKIPSKHSYFWRNPTFDWYDQVYNIPSINDSPSQPVKPILSIHLFRLMDWFGSKNHGLLGYKGI